ncbi:MAG: hypothetical protein GF364_03635, partial [Candidatus Lokiarchaeota archaeon]|nr:hypothetical protein [Candidatus Lokiarchaeota archaeon]
MHVERKTWGQVNGLNSELLIIKCENTGFEVHLTDIGASIVRVRMPDKTGDITDIHYGRANPQAIYDNEDNGYLGSVVGRVASLISFGQFELNGKKYKLTPNMLGIHTQHGGAKGFNTKLWNIDNVDENDNQVSVGFRYISVDGEEGFPGRLTTSVLYTITESMELSWEFRATSDKTTIVNLINHAYWNLDGFGHSINDLHLKIAASKYQHLKMGRLIVESIAHKLHIKRKHGYIAYDIRDCKENGLDFNEFKSLEEHLNDRGDLDHIF